MERPKSPFRYPDHILVEAGLETSASGSDCAAHADRKRCRGEVDWPGRPCIFRSGDEQ